MIKELLASNPASTALRIGFAIFFFALIIGGAAFLAFHTVTALLTPIPEKEVVSFDISGAESLE